MTAAATVWMLDTNILSHAIRYSHGPKAMDGNVIQHYANVRAHLERMGTPIGPNDTLIAAHALTLNCTLVTDNETGFLRVPGLKVENWLRTDS